MLFFKGNFWQVLTDGIAKLYTFVFNHFDPNNFDIKSFTSNHLQNVKIIVVKIIKTAKIFNRLVSKLTGLK